MLLAFPLFFLTKPQKVGEKCYRFWVSEEALTD